MFPRGITAYRNHLDEIREEGGNLTPCAFSASSSLFGCKLLHLVVKPGY